MRFEQLNLSEIFKVGLSKTDITGNALGLAHLKNLRSDGTWLQACPTEAVSKMGVSVIPFTLGIVDYYLKTDGIYDRLTNTQQYAYSFTGRIKIVNLIKVVWIQDDVSTLYMDANGVITLNPSGYETPMATALCTMNGQVLAGGIVSCTLSGYTNLDLGYVGWSGIGVDNFELTKQNDAGIGNPNIGSVLDIQPLQDSAIVFGTRGACQMYYAGHIFGFRDIDIPAIKSKGLCASSTNLVLYVEKSGNLVTVDKNGAATTLGYSWIGKNAIDFKYLNGRNVFVISTSTMSYILDSVGMYSYGYKVYGEFNSTLAVESSFEQLSYEFRTTFWDAARAGMKNMMEIYIRDGLSTLTRYAYGYSETVAATLGAKLLNTLDAVKYVLAGQNLAVGYSYTPDATDVVIAVTANNTTVYGARSSDIAYISAGVTGTTTDANIERLALNLSCASYKFKQSTTKLLVYASNGTTLVATINIPVDGMNLTFGDGTAIVLYTNTQTVTLGGTTVSASTIGAVVPGTLNAAYDYGDVSTATPANPVLPVISTMTVQIIPLDRRFGNASLLYQNKW